MKVTLTPAEQYLIEDIHAETGDNLQLAQQVMDARSRKPELSCISITVDAYEFDYLRHLLGIKWNGGRPKARRK